MELLLLFGLILIVLHVQGLFLPVLYQSYILLVLFDDIAYLVRQNKVVDFISIINK